MFLFLKLLVPRLLGQTVGFFQRLSTPVVMLVAGVLLGMGGIGYLWWSQPSCEEEVALVALDMEKKASALKEKTIVKLMEKTRELEHEVYTLSAKVVEVVPDMPECDLNRGTVSVLNHARTGMPDATGDSPDSAATASTITQQAATQRWIEDAAQYRKCRQQILQLREWYKGVNKHGK